MEEWKKVKLNSMYLVSNKGKIKSLKRGRELILKPYTEKDGYHSVRLYNGYGKRFKSFKVHRLVLETFSPMTGMEINHKNGIKADNRLKNLEWVTRSENVKHAYRIGLHEKTKKSAEKRRSENHPMAKLSNKQVIEIFKFKGTISIRKMAKAYGVSHATISDIHCQRTHKYLTGGL
jgi:hypothetical protein